MRIGAFDEFVASTIAAGALPEPLAEHSSDTLAAIVAQVNKRSINWLADRVIMTAAAARYDEAPTMARAVAAMHEWLGAQVDATDDGDDVVVDTGSGLSYRTQFSTRHIVNVLRRAGGYGHEVTPLMGVAYRDSLSIAGVDGTLRHRFGKGSRGLVRGKTGTLSTVIALSGFVEVDPARPLAFALVTNGHPGRAKLDVRRAHEQLVEAMVEFVRATAPKAAAAIDTGVGTEADSESDADAEDSEAEGETDAGAGADDLAADDLQDATVVTASDAP